MVPDAQRQHLSGGSHGARRLRVHGRPGRLPVRAGRLGRGDAIRRPGGPVQVPGQGLRRSGAGGRAAHVHGDVQPVPNVLGRPRDEPAQLRGGRLRVQPRRQRAGGEVQERGPRGPRQVPHPGRRRGLHRRVLRGVPGLRDEPLPPRRLRQPGDHDRGPGGDPLGAGAGQRGVPLPRELLVLGPDLPGVPGRHDRRHGLVSFGHPQLQHDPRAGARRHGVRRDRFRDIPLRRGVPRVRRSQHRAGAAADPRHSRDRRGHTRRPGAGLRGAEGEGAREALQLPQDVLPPLPVRRGPVTQRSCRSPCASVSARHR